MSMPRAQLLEKKYQDNPNPNAKIGLVIFYPFQFYVHKNIYKHLKNDVEFIIDLGAFHPVKQPEDLLAAIVKLLNKQGAFFRIFHHENYSYQSYQENFFSRYDLLVSLWERGCLTLWCNADKKKVRMAYGSGKELTMYRPSGRIYDLTLAYGERDSQAFSLFSECAIVGNPKFDDWFNDELDTAFLDALKPRLDPSRKTILYLPTHSDLGSIKDLAEPLKKLAQNCNVIVKLHYFNISDEPELVEKLQHEDLIIFKDDIDLLPLLKIADVVVSDNSSAIFDTILADRPIVVTDFLDKDFLDNTHKKAKLYRRGVTRAITYSGSIEQVIKKEGLVATIQKPEQLEDGIKRALEDGSFYKDARRKIRENLFAFNDGKCGERAAQAILDLLNSRELPEKPPLYHALESSLKKTKKDSRRLIFSIVVIHNGAKAEFLKPTLRSLLGQYFAPQCYEIIVVNGPSQEEISEVIREISEIGENIPIVKCIASKYGDPSVECIGNAIRAAEGEIVCFTESGFVLPWNWLLDFYRAHEKYPDVAGVGGYSIKHRRVYTIFDGYYYLELGKKLGVDKEGGRYLRKLSEVKNDLFYQNPAGMFASMSYKKEFLKNVDIDYERIPLIALAEMMIKEKAIQGGSQLCFIPSPVTGLKKLTLGRFVQKNFKEGIAHRLFCLAYPHLKKYYGYGVFSIIKLPILNILDGHSKIRLSLVICIGTLFRWLGKIYAIVSAMKGWNERRD